MTAVAPIQFSGRLALALAAMPRGRKNGGQPYDGDHDGFTTGPDGKDDVPYTPAAKAQAGSQRAVGNEPKVGVIGKVKKLAGESDEQHHARIRSKVIGRGGTPEQATRIADAMTGRTASPGKPQPKAAAGKPAEKAPQPAPARLADVKPRDPSELSDAELASTTETHVKRATDAIAKGDVAGHAAHADRVDKLQAERERRDKAASPSAEGPTSKPPAATPASQSPVPATPVPAAPAPGGGAAKAGWQRTDDPAELSKRLGATMGAQNVLGANGDAPADPDVDLGKATSKAELARRLNRVGADMTRMFDAHPKLAAARDANPIGALGFTSFASVSVNKMAAGGFYARAEGTAVMSLATPGGDEHPLTLDGSHTVSGDALTSTHIARHEYGHHMEHAFPAERGEFEDLYNGHKGGLLGKLTGGNARSAASAKAGWEKTVGTYGASSSSELWAESFAAYTHPDYAKDGKRLPDQLHDFWTKTIG